MTRKFTRYFLVVGLLGLPISLVTIGCSDDAGGNEENVVKATKGVVPPNAPKTPEDYYKQHRK